MKKLLVLSAIAALAITTACAQQDKSKRPSPPAKATGTSASGASITIDYSQPSLKGRSVGKEVAPYGKVWRAGANEPTTLEVSKDVKIEGNPLPAGKYSFWAIPGENEWTIMLSKEIPRWGTQYPEGKDAVRFNVKPGKAPQTTEAMTYTVGKDGKVALLWGDTEVAFTVN